MVDQVDAGGNVIPGIMPGCEGTWEPACDEAAATAGVSKPEICGGPWRNSVYDVTTPDDQDDVRIDETVTFVEEGCFIDDEHRDLPARQAPVHEGPHVGLVEAPVSRRPLLAEQVVTLLAVHQFVVAIAVAIEKSPNVHAKAPSVLVVKSGAFRGFSPAGAVF